MKVWVPGLFLLVGFCAGVVVVCLWVVGATWPGFPKTSACCFWLRVSVRVGLRSSRVYCPEFVLLFDSERCAVAFPMLTICY